jgi:dipeptidyl aminopeptidase/acylaminoacyl peptidase
MPKTFSVDDLLKYELASDLQYSADANAAACQLSQADSVKDGNKTCIWLVPTNGERPRAFTSGDADRDPRWRPKSRSLSFVSTRGGNGPQIHIIERDGGEARQLLALPSGVMSFEWSPDGKHLLILSTVDIDSSKRERSGMKGDTAKHEAGAPQLVWRVPYKLDGIGYTLDTAVHLFVADADTGEYVQLTEGPIEVRSAQWCPHSRQIAFSRTRAGRRAHRTDLWITNADGTAQHQVTEDISLVSYPKWSCDGRRIAFTGAREDGDAEMRPWVFDVDSGACTALGPDDLEVVDGDSVRWSDDGTSVHFVAARRGRQEIASVDCATGAYRTHVGGDRQVSAMTRAGERLLFVSEDVRTPCNVYACELDGTDEQALTTFNEWWSERTLPEVCVKSFDVPADDDAREQIEGWLMRPAGASGPTPLLVDAHGGPASYALVSYVWHAYWHVLLSKGWSVLALNPVGSSSYGREFSTRARKRWGKADLAQQLAAIEQLQREGIADERIAIIGKSYGGYMAAWAIGNASVFRAAVVCAPVISIENHFGVSDSGYYADCYSMYGEPSVRRDVMRALSPLGYVENIRTPTLILQGEDDQRCPRCQAEEFFTSIMTETETPAELVLYPGGDHHLFEEGKPSHRIDVVSRIVDWLERWKNG